MNDFRGPLPLDDRDFADVRRNVLSKIQRRPIAPFVLRFALAAAAVVALVVVLMPRPGTTTNKPPVAVRKPVPVVVVPTHVEPTLSRLAPVENRRHVPPQLVASAGAPPPDSEITMNIETSDPNVRIIWISRQ